MFSFQTKTLLLNIVLWKTSFSKLLSIISVIRIFNFNVVHFIMHYEVKAFGFWNNLDDWNDIYDQLFISAIEFKKSYQHVCFWGSVNLLFEFIYDDGLPVSIGTLYMTFFDIDGERNGVEIIRLEDIDSYYTSNEAIDITNGKEIFLDNINLRGFPHVFYSFIF